MKKLFLSGCIMASLLSSNTAFAMSETEYFNAAQQDIHNQMSERLFSLQEQANRNEGVSTIDGIRYLDVNGKAFKINADNYILFPFLLSNENGSLNESTIRHVFDFFDQNWELTWYDTGFVAVNKLYGNYNSCFLEYYPSGFMGQSGIEHVMLDSSTCALNDFNKEIPLFSVPTYLNKADLELESLNISAIEEYQNRLYVTNDNRPGNIYIIDRDTNKIVDSIDGFYQNDNLNTYSRVNDISIYAGRLYVSSLSSNRVDVFDIKDNHKHIMSLGTGSWAGGNSLVHAQATVANDEYVFAADSNNTVSVYRQEDIIAQNHFKLKQYHRLELEGSADINRTVQMHIFGDYLLANISGRNYYIYDLRQLESSVGQTPLRAIKKVNLNIQKIDIKDDTILASFSNKIEFYALSDFIKNDFIFTQPTKSISQINKERIGGYDDVLLSENNEIIMAKDETISFIPYKKYSLEYTAGSFVEDTKIVFDALPVGTVSQILDNEEAFEIVTNAALRSVRMNSLIKTEILPDKTVRITNYAAKELKDIEIELTLSAVKKWFTLGRIDKIPAFSQIILPLEYFGQNSQFNSVNNDGVFDFSNLFKTDALWYDLIDHRFRSHSDPFAQMLSKLKPVWNISFSAQHDGGQYRKMNALHAKEWLIIMTNFAYMVSQDEFKHLWFNFEDVFGYKMYGNGGPNDVPGGHFLPEDYVHYYDALMARSSISMWRLEMGGGLGNQWNFGISTYGFYSHYYGGWGLIAHEFGHGFDGENLYWDGSGFAAEWAGWQPLIHNLANYHIRKGDLPYMSDDINGFYKDENAKYRSNSVDHNMRRHRSDASMNDIDTYFMGHSKMPQGWFPHRSGFTPETLNNQEKMFLATTRGKNQEGFIDAYACRFDFIEGDETKKLYGFVEKTPENSYVCTGGTEISYRFENSVEIPLISQMNNFDWLSQYSATQKGEPIITQEGYTLCSLNRDEFYGLGFTKNNVSCQQDKSVYWSNGSHWLFSANFRTYSFR